MRRLQDYGVNPVLYPAPKILRVVITTQLFLCSQIIDSQAPQARQAFAAGSSSLCRRLVKPLPQARQAFAAGCSLYWRQKLFDLGRGAQRRHPLEVWQLVADEGELPLGIMAGIAFALFNGLRLAGLPFQIGN